MSKALEILKKLNEIGALSVSEKKSLEAILEVKYMVSRIFELEAQEAKSCEWHYNEGEIVNDEEWIGQCGAVWSFFDDTPKENGMDFCPKCGGKLVEKGT